MNESPPTVDPETRHTEGKRAYTKVARLLMVCRWIGYAAVFLLMSQAPEWAWGLLLAIILKRTNTIHVR